MVRSLWSAATGMMAQQLNVDTIAHNLSNVNTTGYKTDVAEFQSLLYQTLQTATTTANGDPKFCKRRGETGKRAGRLRCQEFFHQLYFYTGRDA